MSPLLPCVGLLSVLLLTPLLSGQQAEAVARPPVVEAAKGVSPILQIDCFGPGLLRELLLPTNVGAMLASEDGMALWRDLAAQIDAGLLELHGDAATFAAARARALDYGGRIRLQLHLPEALSDGDPDGLVVVAEPDGHTDLTAVGADLRVILARATGAAWVEPEPTTGEPAAARLATLALGRDGVLALGIDAQGRLLFAAGRDAAALQRSVVAGLGVPGDRGRPKAGEAAFQVTLDLAQMVQRAMDDASSKKVLQALGCDSLRTLALRLSPNGPHVQLDVALAAEGDRGLFAGLFPEVAGFSDLARLVPPDALGFKTGRCDPLQLWRSCLAAIAAIGASDESVAGLEAEAKAETGIDVAKDLLAHLTGEHLLVWQPSPGADGAEDRADRQQLAFVMKLSDGKAFATAFHTMLQKAGVESKEENGVLRAGSERDWFLPAYRIGVAGNLVALVIGEDLDSRLDRMLARAKEPAPPALDPRLRVLPPGANGYGALSIDLCLRHQLALVHEVIGVFTDLLPGMQPEALAKALTEHRALLQRHQLGSVTTYTGTKLGRWTFRLLW